MICISHFMEAFRVELHKSFEEIDRVMNLFNIEYCFIGGAVLSFYNYLRMTDDVDILVASKDRNKLSKIPIGYMRDISNTGQRRYRLPELNTTVEVIFSGEVLNKGDVPYDEPSLVSEYLLGFPILNLKKLIVYKLSAGMYNPRGRLKDFSDTQELIRMNHLSIDFLDSERYDIQQRYREIWKGTK